MLETVRSLLPVTRVHVRGPVVSKPTLTEGPEINMALPIKQLPNISERVKTQLNNAWYSRTIYSRSSNWRWRQSPPIDRPLPYRNQVVIETSSSRLPTAIEIPDVGYSLPPGASSVRAIAYERAYKKFFDQLRPNASEVGINLAQLKLTRELYKDYLHKFVYMQSLADIAGRLHDFAVNTRRASESRTRKQRNAYRRRAARVLGCRPASDREVQRKLTGQYVRGSLSAFSAEYLAVHYGWSPLFGDIYNLLQMMSEGIGFPPGFYKANGSAGMNTVDYIGTQRRKWHYRHKVTMGAVARVEHELSYSLGVLGLANPAAIVWDAVKWSFVVDWVVSIGPRLNAQTDSLGILFEKTFVTHFANVGLDSTAVNPRQGYNQSSVAMDIDRSVDTVIVPPAIRVKNPIGRSWRKAFAQVSLLAIFGLKPHRK